MDTEKDTRDSGADPGASQGPLGASQTDDSWREAPELGPVAFMVLGAVLGLLIAWGVVTWL